LKYYAADELSDEQALKNLLLDIDCLNQLSPWSGKLNIFDVLKITRTEIRHSNMLAWLMDPNEKHGLRDLFLRSVVQNIIHYANEASFDVFKILMMDYDSFTISREWKNIDLLVLSESERVLLCFENKIESREHSDQLNRYQRIVEQDFPDYIKLYIYLTPDGVDSSVPDIWQSMSYRELMELLEICISQTELPHDTQTLIMHYIEAVRRDIVGDEKLKEICRNIYAKHRQAIDLIIDNKPDAVDFSSSLIRKWCEEKAASGLIVFDPANSSSRLVRFTTPCISGILPDHDEPISIWRTRNMYFYEFYNLEKISIILAMSSKGMSDEQQVACNRLIAILKPNDKKPKWEWKRLFNTGGLTKPELDSDMFEEKTFENLDILWGKVQRFEQDLMKKWNQG